VLEPLPAGGLTVRITLPDSDQLEPTIENGDAIGR